MSEYNQTHINKLLCVIIDGLGVNHKNPQSSAYHHAWTPNLNYLQKHHLYQEIYAHGTHVGLETDDEMGNSEVGHLILGAGNVYDQGSKLISKSILSKQAFYSDKWLSLIDYTKSHKGCLHFLGLLSDGNVHSNQSHLHVMLQEACNKKIKKIRIHVLFDGRDVNNLTAEKYLIKLLDFIEVLTKKYQSDIKVASGGGRMYMTMDRYNSDWSMVKRGWDHHVLAKGEYFDCALEALKTFRDRGQDNDQFLKGFVITDSSGKPCGKICDGDGVVCFNFRADRVIQISNAFEKKDFTGFDRIYHPSVFFLGMTVYDQKNNLPKNYLIKDHEIKNPLSKTLINFGIRQFACSETHKYGHVTYYWNGKRSGYFDRSLEEYLQVPSLNERSELVPWMQADKITDAVIKRIENNSFDFARINYANGDMVGHSGDMNAAVIAVSVVDLMIGRLVKICQKYNTVLLITADHGNCEAMFETDAQNKAKGGTDPKTDYNPIDGFLAAKKTSHTINKVPLYIYIPKNTHKSNDDNINNNLYCFDNSIQNPSLANIAGTILTLMNLKDVDNIHNSSLVKRKILRTLINKNKKQSKIYK